MVNRYINRLEKPDHRRARFRRGFAFGFFSLALLFAAVGWVTALFFGQISIVHAQPLGTLLVPLLGATLVYVVAIIIGEVAANPHIERAWLALCSVLYIALGFWLVFVGALFLLDSLVPS